MPFDSLDLNLGAVVEGCSSARVSCPTPAGVWRRKEVSPNTHQIFDGRC